MHKHHVTKASGDMETHCDAVSSSAVSGWYHAAAFFIPRPNIRDLFKILGVTIFKKFTI
jgi:hypothetical protein